MRVAVRGRPARSAPSPRSNCSSTSSTSSRSGSCRTTLGQVDLRTGAETVVMTLAVIYAWYVTAWGVNWLEPDRLPVRVLLVGLMSVAIPDAFDGRAWLFVTGYLLLQVGRTGFLIVALRGRPQGEHFVNVLVWELLSGCLWVAGAIADADARLVLWGLAVVTTSSE
jgi:low temperature requirement protein LtrA